MLKVLLSNCKGSEEEIISLVELPIQYAMQGMIYSLNQFQFTN